MENNGGDSLARGLPRAQFRPAGANLTEEQWQKLWEPADEDNGGDADVPPARDAGVKPEEDHDCASPDCCDN